MYPTEAAAGINTYGPILAIEHEYPAVSWLFFPFEKRFEPFGTLRASKHHAWLGPVFCALYLLFVYLGPKFMQNRKPYDLRRPLQIWNFFIGFISAWGMVRVVPHLILYVARVGFRATLCIPPAVGYGFGAPGLWSAIFIYSKFVELIDTAFIILRKRQLTFLHWYHHATVLAFSWHAFIVEQPAGIYFCAMNYTVHAVMYFYYYLTSLGSKPPQWGVYVTATQIAQMLIGTSITILSLINISQISRKQIAPIPWSQGECPVSRLNLYEALAVYATYLYLFSSFFWKRYVKPAAIRTMKTHVA